MRDRHSLLSNTTNQQTATMNGQPSVTVRHEDLRVVATANHHSFGGLPFTSADRHQRPGRVQLVARPRVPSGVLRDGGGCGPDVAASELDRVHDERGDLMQGDPTFPAGFERVHLAIRGEASICETTE